MRETDLPSPKIGSTGHHLRRVAAKAISEIQVSAPRYTNREHPNADDLITFFKACAAKVDALSSVSATDNK